MIATDGGLPMARKQIRLDDVLEFAATPRGRATVFWAALAFAACHLIALISEPAAAGLGDALQRQLIHFSAVLCRFVLPCAVMLTGTVTYIANKLREGASGTQPRSL
jgi:hypothetical protein